MTLDHVAWALFPGFSENALSLLAHTIGRISCPIFCYFVAEGFHRTRDVGKYAARIFAFALLSHFAYVFASDDFAGAASFLPFFRGRILNQTSVFWSLAWGLTMLRVNASERYNDGQKTFLIGFCAVMSLIGDWNCVAAFAVFLFGTRRKDDKGEALAALPVFLCSAVFVFFASPLYGVIQLGTAFSVPLLWCYNGERDGASRGNALSRRGFYLYYPLHLFLIGLLL